MSIPKILTEIRNLINAGNRIRAKELIADLLGRSIIDVYAVNSMAELCFSVEEYESAIAFYYKVISLKNADPLLLYNIGLCYQKLKNHDKACLIYRQALEINPDYSDALNNLGLVLAEMKDFTGAEKCFLKSIAINPSDPHSLANLGLIKAQQCDYNGIIELHEYVLKLLENNKNSGAEKENLRAIALNNIGFANYKLGNIDEAEKYYDLSLVANPDYVISHYNRAQVLLLKGDFKRGFAEYEWRKRKGDWGPRVFTGLPASGELYGKTVLVYCEQGLGDAIQFIRYLKLLCNSGCKIIVESDKSLIALFRTSLSGVQFVERDLVNPPAVDFDYSIPILSLPLYFSTDMDSIPSDIPYIRPESSIVEMWRGNLAGRPGFKVGIVWGGNPNHFNDARRSCRLSDFSVLFGLDGIQLYSLQVGPAITQIQEFPNDIINLQLSNNYGFSGTAAMIENLDLVISVDTSVAHLAGAMGKPVWLLLPHVPDWRWLLEQDDSRWYPSARLYRQQIPGDWQAVFNKIREGLLSVQGNALSFPALSLALTKGADFGWGVCTKYLKAELSRITEVRDAGEDINGEIPGIVLHTLVNKEFEPQYKVRGQKNFGYTFFELELNDKSVENAKKYNAVIGGSSWNKEKMIQKGILNAAYLPQGIDPELFYPGESQNRKDLFVIFSGGKFEFRKGQDIVLKAIKILQVKYQDIVLVNAWYNKWPQTMDTMCMSRHISYKYHKGECWEDTVSYLTELNEMDSNRIITIPLVPNNELRSVYLKSDIGLFPNRCEGGTNLVLMEYMACGKPAIASYNTGHKDILNDSNSYPVTQMRGCKIKGPDGALMTDWFEPDLDEIIEKIEYAYFHRSEIKETGQRAGEFMKDFTWGHTAKKLMGIIQDYE